MRNFILFDEHQVWENLLPLTYTRPVSALRIGILTISEKWKCYLNQEVSFLTEDYLKIKYPLLAGGEDVFINSALIPKLPLVNAIKKLQNHQVLLKNDKILAVVGDIARYYSDPELFTPVQYDERLRIVNHLWDIFLMNHEEIMDDFELLTRNRKSAGLSRTNHIFGNYPVFTEEGVKAECAVFNTTHGPVYLGKNAVVMEGSLIQGPFALGEGSQVKLGAKIYPGTTIGPHCRVGGELNNVVFQGYSNKAHDGFLGNAVIGEWCNIGADSNNSNLKNTYENVKVWNYREKSFINSGLQFCGLFMGDHSKCGINTMFNTGTSVGVSANIFGAGFPRNFIPSFVWGGPSGFTTYRLEKAFESMKAVMARRNCELTEADISILTHIFEISREFRQ